MRTTEEEVRQKLAKLAQDKGSRRKLADSIDINYGFLCEVIAGKKPVTERLASVVNCERVTRWVDYD